MAFQYLPYEYSHDPTLDRRNLRSVDNPFHLPAGEFQELYRLTPDVVEDLIYQLDGQLRGSRITAISTEKQVLAALHFFATGCYQRPVGEQWGIFMSQSSISRCIHRVTDAINRSMFFAKVTFPMTLMLPWYCVWQRKPTGYWANSVIIPPCINSPWHRLLYNLCCWQGESLTNGVISEYPRLPVGLKCQTSN